MYSRLEGISQHSDSELGAVRTQTRMRQVVVISGVLLALLAATGSANDDETAYGGDAQTIAKVRHTAISEQLPELP